MTTGALRSFGRSFRHGLVAACLASTGLVAVAGGASAQFYDRDIEAVLPPRAVVWRLSRQGFTALSHPRFDGVSYVVEAESSWGNRVRLFVDARSGAIMERERLEAPLYPPGAVGRPGYGWTEDEVVRAPRPDARYARAVPDAPPTNPFASNYPSRPPTPAETRTANPSGLNPDGLPGVARESARPPAPRRTAKLAPPKPTPAVPPARPPEAAPAPVVAPVTPSANAAPVQPPAPSAAPAAAPPVQQDAAAAPPRQVRVIGGVTPVQGDAKPAEKPTEAPKGPGAPE